MKPLYIGSVRPYSGKSLVAIGVASHYMKKKKKVGFYKPVGTIPTKVRGVWTEEDAVMTSEIVGQDVPLERICSVVLTPDLVNQAYKGKAADHLPQVRKDFRFIKNKCEFLVVEGAQDLFVGAMIGLPAFRLVRLLKARLIVVNRFESDLDADTILAVKHYLKDDFAGVIFNNVPRQKMDYLDRLVTPMLRKNGVEVFGNIPRDKVLSSVTVREIAEMLGAEVLCGQDAMDRAGDRFFIGAMNLEQSYQYFKKNKNKIVIVGGDRADVQLAALETDTVAVVLTGGMVPNDIILAKADEVGIPLLRARGHTYDVVDRLETALGQLRLDNTKKVKRGIELVAKKVDFKKLEKHLK